MTLFKQFSTIKIFNIFVNSCWVGSVRYRSCANSFLVFVHLGMQIPRRFVNSKCFELHRFEKNSCYTTKNNSFLSRNCRYLRLYLNRQKTGGRCVIWVLGDNSGKQKRKKEAAATPRRSNNLFTLFSAKNTGCLSSACFAKSISFEPVLSDRSIIASHFNATNIWCHRICYCTPINWRSITSLSIIHSREYEFM